MCILFFPSKLYYSKVHTYKLNETLHSINEESDDGLLSSLKENNNQAISEVDAEMEEDKEEVKEMYNSEGNHVSKLLSV